MLSSLHALLLKRLPHLLAGFPIHGLPSRKLANLRQPIRFSFSSACTLSSAVGTRTDTLLEELPDDLRFASVDQKLVVQEDGLVYGFDFCSERGSRLTAVQTSADYAWTQDAQAVYPEEIGENATVARNAAELEVDERFLRCCEPGKKLKIGVLLSGGVDSSVALRLLCAAGHSCTAFYLKIWFQEAFENFWASCPWDDDLKFAQAVCDEVGVQLHVVHLTEEYWSNVVSYMIAEYHAGRTPNPDVLCNSRIKFGTFLERIKDMGLDRVASGHYARVERIATGSEGSQAVLCLSKDEVKDQTYFLSHLSQSQLLQLIFPLGCVSKEEVRQLADWMGLPNKDRKDSQGICFLGKVKFSDFICKHLGEREGRILEAESGKYLGMHRGFWFYTIGQRQGLGLSNGPWYVVDKELEYNVVFVSRDYFSVDKKRRTFQVSSLNWFEGHPPSDQAKLRCKVRHGPNFYDCSLFFSNSQSNPVFESTSNSAPFSSAIVKLSADDQGIAAGQYAAFYEGDVCLGSGIIDDFQADQSSAVSAEAREAARVKDIPLLNQSKSRKKKSGSDKREYSKETKALAGPEGMLDVLTGDEQTESKTSLKVQENQGWFSGLRGWVKRQFGWLGKMGSSKSLPPQVKDKGDPEQDAF